MDTTGIQDDMIPSDEDKVNHEDIDLPISQTADTTLNEGHFKFPYNVVYYWWHIF